eukprot:gene11612-4854_t
MKTEKLSTSMSRLSLSEENKSLQRKYNMFILQAKKLEKEKKFSDSLQNYQSAYKLFQNQDLKSKINSLLELEYSDSEEEYDFIDKEEDSSFEEDPQPEKENFTIKTLNITEKKKHEDSTVEYKDFPPFIFNKEKNIYQLTGKKDTYCIDPKTLNSLYGYQRKGVEWLFQRHSNKGCILGDGLRISNLASHFIIGMPVSVIGNWKKEFGKWARKMPVYVYHNVTQVQRTKILKEFNKTGGVVLTTYGMITSQIENFTGICKKIDYIVLDEGHKIKNSSTKLAKNLRLMKVNHRVILSGTPIQNNLMEMWSLYDYIFEGQLLGTSRSFSNEFAKKIERGNHQDATSYEKKIAIQTSDKLKEVVGKYFLRREKSKVLNDLGSDKKKISQKNDLVVWVTLSKPQLKLYQDYLSSDDVKAVLNQTSSALASLGILKQICDHPMLLKKDLFKDELSRVSNVTETIEESGKLKITRDLLKDLKKNNHRVLIFSQSTKMLDLIELLLYEDDHSFLRIDGTMTDSRKRQDLIDAYNKNSNYFFYKDTISKTATQKSSNQFRYFTRDELAALMTLDNPFESETQKHLASLHTNRNTYPELEEHLKLLKSFGIFGTSDHDLLFNESLSAETFDHIDSNAIQKEVEESASRVFSEKRNNQNPFQKQYPSNPSTSKVRIPQKQDASRLTALEFKYLIMGVRLFGDLNWKKILESFQFNQRNAMFLKGEWEKIKKNCHYTQLELVLKSYDKELFPNGNCPPIPKLQRNIICIDDEPNEIIKNVPNFDENLPSKQVKNPSPKVKTPPPKRMDKKTTDDSIIEIDAISPISTRRESTNGFGDISLNDSVFSDIRDASKLIDSDEDDIDDDVEYDLSLSPEAILKKMPVPEKKESMDEVAKRLSICMGISTPKKLLKQSKRKIMLSDSEDEEEGLNDICDQIDHVDIDNESYNQERYQQLIDEGKQKERNGNEIDALDLYMSAFAISKHDESLEYKIFTLGEKNNMLQ